MQRRKVLKSGAAIAAAGLAGCTGNSNSDDSENSYSIEEISTWPPEEYEDNINVWSWNTEYRDEAVPAFTEKYDISNYSMSAYSSPGQWYSEIQGSHSIDNIGSTGEFTKRAMDNDLSQPVPVNHMPNWERVVDPVQEEMETTYGKNGDVYGFPTVYYLIPVIVYNEEFFDSPPTTWDIFWDESLEGQIEMIDRDYLMMQVAAQYAGQDPLSPSDWDELEEVLQEQKPLNRTYWTNFDAIVNRLSNGTVKAAPAGVAQAVECRVENDAPINYSIPESGGYYELDNLIIPQGAPNPIAGAMYSNYALSDAGIKTRWETKYTPTFAEDQKEVMESLIDDEEIFEMAYFSQEQLSNIQVRTPLSEEDRERTAELYTTITGS